MQLVGPLILALLLQLLPLGWLFHGVAPVRFVAEIPTGCDCCPAAAQEAIPTRCPGCPVAAPVAEARLATNARERAPDEVVNEQLGPMPSYPLVEAAGPIVLKGWHVLPDRVDEPDRRRATLGIWTI